MRKLMTILGFMAISWTVSLAKADVFTANVTADLFKVATEQIVQINTLGISVDGNSTTIKASNGLRFLGIPAVETMPLNIGDFSKLIALFKEFAINKIVSDKVSITLGNGEIIVTVPVHTPNNAPAVSLGVGNDIFIQNLVVTVHLQPRTVGSDGIQLLPSSVNIAGDFIPRGAISILGGAITSISQEATQAAVSNQLHDYFDRPTTQGAFKQGLLLFGGFETGEKLSTITDMAISPAGIKISYTK